MSPPEIIFQEIFLRRFFFSHYAMRSELFSETFAKNKLGTMETRLKMVSGVFKPLEFFGDELHTISTQHLHYTSLSK